MNTFKAETKNRLDKTLANELDVSRNQIEKLIKDGLVSVFLVPKLQLGDAYITLISPKLLNFQ